MLKIITTRVAVRVISFLIIAAMLAFFGEARAQIQCPPGEQKVYRFFNNQLSDGRLGTGAPNCTQGSNQSFTVQGVVNACQETGTDPWTQFYTYTWEPAGAASYSSGMWRAYQIARRPNSTNTAGNELRISEHCIPAQECEEDVQGFWKVSIGEPNPDTVCKAQCLYRATKNRLISVEGFTDQHKTHYTSKPPGRCEISESTPAPEDIQSTPGPTETPIGNHEPFGTPVEQSQVNCGYINGEVACLDEPTGDGTCTQLASGAGFCVTDADPADEPPRLPPDDEGGQTR